MVCWNQLKNYKSIQNSELCTSLSLSCENKRLSSTDATHLFWHAADIYLRFHGPVHGGRLGCRAAIGVRRLGARRHRRLLRFGLGRLRGTLHVLPVSLVGLLREHKGTRGSEVSAGAGSEAPVPLEGVEKRPKPLVATVLLLVPLLAEERHCASWRRERFQKVNLETTRLGTSTVSRYRISPYYSLVGQQWQNQRRGSCMFH